MAGLEKPLEHSILDFLTMNKIFVFKVNNTGIYDPKTGRWRRPNSKHIIKGVSDILGTLPDGRFLAIEVKAPGKKYTLTMHQESFLKQVVKNNGVGFVADSLEDVQENLSSYLPIRMLL